VEPQRSEHVCGGAAEGVKWFRLGAVLIIVALAALALRQTAATPAATVKVEPTRVALPTLAPPAIVSRTSREPPPTPTPRARSTAPQVEIVDYGYSPAQLTIHAGQNVTWVNQGADGHDVTGSDWHSGPLTPQEAYTRVFAQPGTYGYECTMHPEMRGTVIVQ
jgi:plastocyanin